MAAEAESRTRHSGLRRLVLAGGPRSTWVQVVFGVLFLLNVAPLILLGLMGGWTSDAWKDPSYPMAFLLVCAAPLVAVAGLVGARRGWNALVLSVLALMTIAWPLFVAWVLLNIMLTAAIAY